MSCALATEPAVLSDELGDGFGSCHRHEKDSALFAKKR